MPGGGGDPLAQRGLPDPRRPFAEQGLLELVGEVHRHRHIVVGEIPDGGEPFLDLARRLKATHSPPPLLYPGVVRE